MFRSKLLHLRKIQKQIYDLIIKLENLEQEQTKPQRNGQAIKKKSNED